VQAAIAAPAAESERRIAQADAAMKAAGAPIPPNSHQPKRRIAAQRINSTVNDLTNPAPPGA
jgi:hypothetical protein